MPERVVWGLDIGQTAIRAVKLETVKGAKEASAVITDTFFRNLDTTLDDPEYDAKVEAALQDFVAEKHPDSQSPVAFSIPGANTLFRSFPVPAVSGGKLREVISYEAKQLIPYPLEEVVWDYQTLGVNEDTGEIQLALICCLREKITEHLSLMDRLGIPVADIQIAPLALVNFCRYDFYNEGRMLLLDFGARSTDFVIFDDSIFWLRSIPVCGNDISKVLMNKFSINYAEAEQLKTADDSRQASRVFRTVESTMRNLAQEVQRSIGFYRSTKRDATINELLLAGNSFMLEGADQFMADSLGCGARTFDLPERITVAPGVDENEILQNRQVYGIAAGVALQGLGLAFYNCSLLPEDRKVAKLIKQKEPWGWAAAVLVVLTVIVQIMFTSSKKPLYEKDMQNIDKALRTSENRYKEYNDALNQFKPAQNINRSLVAMEGNRDALDDAYEKIHQMLRSFNETQQKPWYGALAGIDNLREFEKEARKYINADDDFKKKNEALLAEKRDAFKADYENEAVKDKPVEIVRMDDNLRLQVLRQMMFMFQRHGRAFVTQETYTLAHAVKTVDPEDKSVSWTLEKSPVKTLQGFGQTAKAASARRAASKDDEAEDDNADAADGKKQTVVIVDLKLYVVEDSSEAVKVTNKLKEKIESLKRKDGFYLLTDGDVKDGVDFDKEAGDSNILKVPAIYSPLAKEISDDEMGERGELSRDETMSWENVTEKKHAFKIHLLFEPKETKADLKRLKDVADDAKKFLNNLVIAATPAKPEEKPAAAPAPAADKAETAKPEEKPAAAPAPAADKAEAVKAENKPVAAPAPVADKAEAAKPEDKPAAAPASAADKGENAKPADGKAGEKTAE